MTDPRPSGEPAAYLHTLHMELEQTIQRLTFDADDPFGVKGQDYDPSYYVTTEPLYRAR